MTRKVIIDCDPGIDDALALCLALFEPRLEVLAVTAVEGRVTADTASRNVQATIDQLDPHRMPRVGRALANEAAPFVPSRRMNGEDGLGNAGFAVSELHHQHLSEKIICDEVRSNPDEVTIICLGPLTNVAAAFTRDPELHQIVNQVIISGGSVNGVGDVSAAAEFNMYFDPASARTVLNSRVTKTMIPLEVTQKIVFTLDFVQRLPDERTRAGRFLRRMIPFAFRAYRQHLGQESVFFNDVVTLVAALHPELFEITEMVGDVEVSGELTTGMTVFDRRPQITDLPNVAVATEIHAAGVHDCILRGIAEAGRQT